MTVRREVPLRRSLLVRLLSISLLIVVCAIVTAAWLATRGATRAIEQAQGQALSDDAQVYDTLVGYAADHASWDGVDGLLTELAGSTGRRIVLTTLDRRLIAQSSPSDQPLPARASATVDPLRTDPVLRPSTSETIDARAVGPFRLTAAERDQLHIDAQAIVRCLEGRGVRAVVHDTPSGRPVLNAGDDPKTQEHLRSSCSSWLLLNHTPTEARSFAELDTAVNDCLRDRGLPGAQALDMFVWRPHDGAIAPSAEHIDECVAEARRRQLQPFVAPAALLFTHSPSTSSRTEFALSDDDVVRIIAATGLVLAVAVAATTLLATRLTRPLRALIAAVRGPDGRWTPVPATRRDEIGLLIAAFNDLAARREQAEERRHRMVNDVAHELRTPLTTIRSWLEATQDGLTTPASDPALTALLLNETLHLQYVVDDLRDLAAADAGKLRLNPEPVRLADVLEEVVAAHSGAADAADVTVTWWTTGSPVVTADAVRLRQAVGNLVSNAVRHTPPGGDVTVRGGVDAGEVVIEVADTGTGIAPEDLPHVFERFWRADKSRSRETGGSGLGLAIVRQLVRAHGGEVEVTSTPGIGSTFTLRLPATDTPAP
ncbi:two-component system, OmpR family, sensor histidine kinase BaeS [Lentzea xinjiangensis]|uniref:histidine kinase n=1 Tax=Lentzea xinjiangensis TaxID=402600 RepID=A0A1H9TRJ5_9PSEU|nr:HAMP domain-containing sensor histidine kinase [Lentzea xinjiangensis]SER99601.1 two-component system, OmpR family, sensor histidine kinase BaeS [Lentzea xinjiangensis]